MVERGGIAGGTTSACEGNILVSDKGPGPELDLALLSARLWLGLRDELGEAALEYEPKGGVVVARSAATARWARRVHGAPSAPPASTWRTSGRRTCAALEPNLTRDVAGGAFYPQDAQVQPMLAAAALLRRARDRGAVVHTGTAVTGFLRDGAGG